MEFLAMKYFLLNLLFTPILAISGCGSNDLNQTIELSGESFIDLANELQIDNFYLRKDSSQLIIEINDSNLARRYLDLPLNSKPDSIYFLSLQTAQRMNQLLTLDYVYERIYLTFKFNGEQEYYFDYCVQNCERAPI